MLYQYLIILGFNPNEANTIREAVTKWKETYIQVIHHINPELRKTIYEIANLYFKEQTEKINSLTALVELYNGPNCHLDYLIGCYNIPFEIVDEIYLFAGDLAYYYAYQTLIEDLRIKYENNQYT